MSLLCHREAWCAWCDKRLGFTSKDYCNAACKQSHYRYRKRGMLLPRAYRKKTDKTTKKGGK